MSDHPAIQMARRFARSATIPVMGTLGPSLPKCRRGLKGLTIFVFHDVTANPSPYSRDLAMATHPDLFRRQLEWIVKDFAVVSAQDLANDDPSPRAALLTFDDGFSGFRTTALPILEEFSLPATVFLNMNVVDGDPITPSLAAWLGDDHPDGDRWRDSTPERYALRLKSVVESDRRSDLQEFHGPYLNADDLRELSGHPLVSIGNHLDNHWSVPHLEDSEFETALLENQRRLDLLKNSVPWYAPPHGLGTPARDSRAIELGMERVLTGGGSLNPDPMATILDRIDIDHTITSRLAFRWRLTFRTLFPRRIAAWTAGHRRQFVGRWARRDSNPRPPPCKSYHCDSLTCRFSCLACSNAISAIQH